MVSNCELANPSWLVTKEVYICMYYPHEKKNPWENTYFKNNIQHCVFLMNFVSLLILMEYKQASLKELVLIPITKQFFPVNKTV